MGVPLDQTGFTKKPCGYFAGFKRLLAFQATFQPVGPAFAGIIFKQDFIAAAVADEFATAPEFVNPGLQFPFADHKDWAARAAQPAIKPTA